jgi:hypothetical protein
VNWTFTGIGQWHGTITVRCAGEEVGGVYWEDGTWTANSETALSRQHKEPYTAIRQVRGLEAAVAYDAAWNRR